MSAGELIVRCFNARTAAHIAHFQTRSYAQHKALNDFYDDIVEATDEWAENYQGLFGIVQNYPSMPVPMGSPIPWMEENLQWLKASRSSCCKGATLLENLHDNIQAVFAQTLYKLKFLDNPAMGASMMDTDNDGDGPMPPRSDEYMKMGKW